MDEPTPPPTPQEPQSPIVPREPSPPNPLLAAGAGALLLIISIAACFIYPPAFFLGLVGAIISLFQKGYRWVFLGYIITIGVLLLCAIAYCSIYPVRFD